MTDEAIFTDRDKFTYEGVGLNTRARSNTHAPLDLNEWPDKHVIAEAAAVEVTWLRYDNSSPKGNINHHGSTHFGTHCWRPRSGKSVNIRRNTSNLKGRRTRAPVTMPQPVPILRVYQRKT